MTEGINPSEGFTAVPEAAEVPLERVNASALSIDGEVVWVGKLGLDQLVAATRTLVAAAVRMTPEERLQLATAGKAAAQEGARADEAAGHLAAALMVLDESTVRRVAGIVVGKSDEWAGQHIGLLDVLLIAEAILKHNKIEELKAVFLRLPQLWRSSSD